MEMMEPSNKTIELLEPEEYRKRHPPKESWQSSSWKPEPYKPHKSGGIFGGGFGKTDDDDLCIYD